ncbi:hypothetical protein D9M71_652420 [compost metagenome]
MVRAAAFSSSVVALVFPFRDFVWAAGADNGRSSLRIKVNGGCGRDFSADLASSFHSSWYLRMTLLEMPETSLSFGAMLKLRRRPEIPERPSCRPLITSNAITRTPTEAITLCVALRPDQKAMATVAPMTVRGLARTATSETSPGPLTSGINAEACAARMYAEKPDMPTAALMADSPPPVINTLRMAASLRSCAPVASKRAF